MDTRARVWPRIVALLAVAAGCSDATGSGDDLTGTWSYEADLIASGNGAVCEIAPITFEMTQNGSALTGEFGAGGIACSGPATTSIPAGLDLAGTVASDDVAFTIDGSYWSHTGTRSGGSMSGEVTLTAPVNGATGTLTGTWTATRP